MSIRKHYDDVDVLTLKGTNPRVSSGQHHSINNLWSKRRTHSLLRDHVETIQMVHRVVDWRSRQGWRNSNNAAATRHPRAPWFCECCDIACRSEGTLWALVVFISWIWHPTVEFVLWEWWMLFGVLPTGPLCLFGIIDPGSVLGIKVCSCFVWAFWKTLAAEASLSHCIST